MLTEQQRLSMLETPRGLIDLVIDSDTYNEIDDQFAISYALHAPERLNVRAIYAAPFLNHRSTSPADGMERSYHEIHKLLALAGQTKDVFRGSPCYLPDEQTPVPSPAAEDLSRRAMDYSPEKPLYVAALGAITNVASALLLNPAIADRMVVVWLGGHSFEWDSNREFNMQQDVAAARVVYLSGVPLVMLPCFGVTSAFTTTAPELNYWLRGRNALCNYLVENTIDEAESYAKGRVWSRVIWDVTAIGWLLNEDEAFMRDRLISTPIPLYQHCWQQTTDAPLCRYVFYIKRDALFADLFARLSAREDAP
ncbi:MAG: nucleoside hydrolase [Clostridiales bacterium]|nr:nucleoside hydrolase [Clostridiales bacterium]